MLQNPGKALRKLLQGPDIIMAPGIYDCILLDIMLPVRSGASRPAAFDDTSIARFSVHFLSNFYHAVFKQMTHISASVFADSHGMQNKK